MSAKVAPAPPANTDTKVGASQSQHDGSADEHNTQQHAADPKSSIGSPKMTQPVTPAAKRSKHGKHPAETGSPPFSNPKTPKSSRRAPFIDGIIQGGDDVRRTPSWSSPLGGIEPFTPSGKEGPSPQTFLSPRSFLASPRSDPLSPISPPASRRQQPYTARGLEALHECAEQSAQAEQQQREGLEDERVHQEAAAALTRFKEASGLRKATAAIVEFINREPPDPSSIAHYRWQLAKLTETLVCRVFFICLVTVNAMLMWVQADTNGDPAMWMTIETIFVAFFTLEVVAKLVGFGLVFFAEPWNTLDFFIVGFSVVELCIAYIMDTSDTSAISTIRMVRVFRIIRMMSILDRLNMLVRAFFYACQDIVWVVALLVIVLYIFAIMARGFFGKGDSLTKAGFDQAATFGTVPRTMVTMFQIMTLDSWASQIARPVGEVFPGSQLFFVVFVLVGSLGVLNLLTAIFIDSLNTLNKEGAIEEADRRDENKKLLLAALTQVFEECDIDHSGELDKEEMSMAMFSFQSPEYREAFASVGLDLAMMEGMLKHADTDLSGMIDFNEFTEGIKNMDATPVKADIWALQGKLNEIANTVLGGQEGVMKRVLEGQNSLLEGQGAMMSNVLLGQKKLLRQVEKMITENVQRGPSHSPGPSFGPSFGPSSSPKHPLASESPSRAPSLLKQAATRNSNHPDMEREFLIQQIIEGQARLNEQIQQLLAYPKESPGPNRGDGLDLSPDRGGNGPKGSSAAGGLQGRDPVVEHDGPHPLEASLIQPSTEPPIQPPAQLDPLPPRSTPALPHPQAAGREPLAPPGAIPPSLPGAPPPPPATPLASTANKAAQLTANKAAQLPPLPNTAAAADAATPPKSLTPIQVRIEPWGITQSLDLDMHTRSLRRMVAKAMRYASLQRCQFQHITSIKLGEEELLENPEETSLYEWGVLASAKLTVTLNEDEVNEWGQRQRIWLLEAQTSHAGGLIQAAFRNDLEAARILVQGGHDVNQSYENGRSALYCAAWADSPEVAQLLIEHGADPNLGNAAGTTPVISASKYNNVEVLEVLLAHRADVNQRDQSHMLSAVYSASRRGSLEALEVLMANGANRSLAFNSHETTTPFTALEQCRREGGSGARSREVLLFLQQNLVMP